MSKRAEQAALEAYPKSEGIRELKGLSARPTFIQGYEQAEKDLALTWEDIKVIYEIFDALDNEHHSTFNMGIQQYFQEALRRFREMKRQIEIRNGM